MTKAQIALHTLIQELEAQGAWLMAENMRKELLASLAGK